jgi:hypothetical protein
MNLIQAIKKALWDKYQTSTLWTVQEIPFYLDHTPQGTTAQPLVYPIICAYHVDAKQSMAMPTVAQPGGFDYADSRFSLVVYGNDRNHVAIETIADTLEDLFHRQSLPTLTYGVNHIATISIDSRTLFYDKQQKIWQVQQYYRILVGK